jgi:hypothetical protein
MTQIRHLSKQARARLGRRRENVRRHKVAKAGK